MRAGDDAQVASAAEVDVLTSLTKRRGELDARQAQIQIQANMLAATEARVDTKIAQLKSLQGQIAALLAQRDAEQEKQVDALVKTYSAMKPKDAARIFDSLMRQRAGAGGSENEVGCPGAGHGGDESRAGPEADSEAGQQVGPARHGPGPGPRGPPAARAGRQRHPGPRARSFGPGPTRRPPLRRRLRCGQTRRPGQKPNLLRQRPQPPPRRAAKRLTANPDMASEAAKSGFTKG